MNLEQGYLEISLLVPQVRDKAFKHLFYVYASDMLLQLDFDYRFNRAIKEQLKRQCLRSFA